MSVKIENKYTVDYIRSRLRTSDQWLMIGLLTIYNNQTDAERNVQQTQEVNGIGFNGPDSNSLSKCSTWLLRHTSVVQLRRLPNIRLESFFTAEWAQDTIRNKMPKYAKQLTIIANENYHKSKNTQREFNM